MSGASSPIPDLSGLAQHLRSSLHAAGYTSTGVSGALAESAVALARGEIHPVHRALAREGVDARLATLIRLFLLQANVAHADAALAFAPLDVATLDQHGVLIDDGAQVRAAVDIRPIDLADDRDHWVISDLDSVRDDRVIGTGQASRSLLQAIPTEPVSSILDLGTGCGVQGLHTLSFGERLVATDVTDRALAFARATMDLNDIADDRAEFRRGPWYAPVADETFDLIVANPPFVVGPATVTHTYRDSGLDLDGASRAVITGCRDRLRPGGMAVMLASWIITGPDWRLRLADWFDDHGLDAWVLQRDVADPALYVGTWLRDEGLDPASPEGQRRSREWLDRFDDEGVTGIGFGFVYIRRTDHSSDVLMEELTGDFTDPLGTEAAQYFARVAWLRDADILQEQLQLADDVALEQVSTIGTDEAGWQRAVTRLHRTGGPRWVHEVDPEFAAILAGLRHDGLPLSEVVDLYSAMSDIEIDPDEVATLTHALIRHGMVVPPSSDAEKP